MICHSVLSLISLLIESNYMYFLRTKSRPTILANNLRNQTKTPYKLLRLYTYVFLVYIPAMLGKVKAKKTNSFNVKLWCTFVFQSLSSQFWQEKFWTYGFQSRPETKTLIESSLDNINNGKFAWPTSLFDGTWALHLLWNKGGLLISDNELQLSLINLTMWL